MKKHVLIATIWCLVIAGLATQAVTAQEIQSLRGMEAIDAASSDPVIRHYQKDNEVIPRDYLQQPPLIPHQIDAYVINIKHNKCLSCHSWTNYKQNNATKISQTHFESRDGAILANVSPLRYFCTQCHVPQSDARPLVENTFKPVDALKVR